MSSEMKRNACCLYAIVIYLLLSYFINREYVENINEMITYFGGYAGEAFDGIQCESIQ